MTGEAALLAAIIANRAEDTPRLVYADWLEENGQPERAEFVRVQVELARVERNCPGPDLCRFKRCEYCELRHRERDLLEARRYSWLDGMLGDGWKLTGMQGNLINYHRVLERTQSINPEFSRGFVSTLTLQWSDWLAHHAAILARQPVERVKLMDHADLDDETDLVNLCREKLGDTFSLTQPEMLKAIWPGIEFELPPMASGTGGRVMMGDVAISISGWRMTGRFGEATIQEPLPLLPEATEIEVSGYFDADAPLG